MRLTTWAEMNGIRATGQYGFRPGRRTTDAIFIMQNVIESQRQQGMRLFGVFVDFEKAYDSVRRERLWRKMEDRGIHGSMLRRLKALYANVPLTVKLPSGPSEVFASTIGLRQGCPLSPTLFGLYIDDLETHITQGPNFDLPALGVTPVPPLMFADDVALLSTTREGLQRQLDALQAYAARWSLRVNTAKTKVVIFNPLANPRARRHRDKYDFTYDNSDLEICDTFNYLGALLHAIKPMQEAGNERIRKARKALHLFRRMARRNGIQNT